MRNRESDVIDCRNRTPQSMDSLFAIPAFSTPDSALYTSSGVFTVPDGVTSLTIEAVGGGGNGGPNGGGGGGGGGYAFGTYTVISGTKINVTVGLSGGGGGGAGSIGYDQTGFSAFNELCVAVGGLGGLGGGYDYLLCDPPQRATGGQPSGAGGGGSGNTGLGSPGYVKFVWDVISSVFEDNAEMWKCVHDWESGSADISVYDLTGCKIVSPTYNLSPTTYGSLSPITYNLPPGTYYLVHVHGTHIHTSRIMKY